MMYKACKGCGGMNIAYVGKNEMKREIYKCKTCNHTGEAFEGDMEKLNKLKTSLKKSQRVEDDMKIDFGEKKEKKGEGKFGKIKEVSADCDDVEFL